VKNISPVLALKVAMFNLHPQSFSPLLQTKWNNIIMTEIHYVI
jgi:hypothetical protein